MPILLMVATGCSTWTIERRDDKARNQLEMDNLTVRVAQLEERIDGIMSAQEAINRRIDELEKTQTTGDRAVRSELAELKQESAGILKAQEAMKKELVQKLSSEMANLVRETAPAASQGSQVGRWHVVETGQTLSEIARAYNATVKAIVEANDSLKTADTIIRPGQKLFIPE